MSTEQEQKKELKQMTLIEALRTLTGMFNPDHAIHVLAFANLIARKLDNDPILDDEFLLEQFRKIGIELVLNEKS